MKNQMNANQNNKKGNSIMNNNDPNVTAVPFPGFLPRGLRPAGKYDGECIRWLDKADHYELVFTDDFVTPGGGSDFDALFGGPKKNPAILTDIILDMREGDHEKEVWVFVGSFGGEVAALCMILQQLLAYKKRIGFNLGCACSCGWMLLFACQERYVSPFSQAMYHDIATMTAGKHSELRRNAEFMDRWQQELLKVTDTLKVLTPVELELGRTSEVWLTGRELIDRGAAKDYDSFRKPSQLIPATDVFRMSGQLVQKTPSGWVKLQPAEKAGDDEDAQTTAPETVSHAKRGPRSKNSSGKAESGGNEASASSGQQ